MQKVKITRHKAFNQAGEVITTYGFRYYDKRGIVRYETTKINDWIQFCKSAGINYIGMLEVKKGDGSKLSM